MQPKPKKETRYRIYGPYQINGMNVWKVIDLMNDKIIGPPCLSLQEAINRADDALHGRVRVWLGFSKFKPHKI